MGVCAHERAQVSAFSIFTTISLHNDKTNLDNIKLLDKRYMKLKYRFRRSTA